MSLIEPISPSLEDWVALLDRQHSMRECRDKSSSSCPERTKIEIGIYEVNTPSAPIIDGITSTPVRIGYSTHPGGLNAELEQTVFSAYELLCTCSMPNWLAAATLMEALCDRLQNLCRAGPKPMWFLINSEKQRRDLIAAFNELDIRGPGRPSLGEILLNSEPRLDVEWLFQRLLQSAKSNLAGKTGAEVRLIAHRMRTRVLRVRSDRLSKFQQLITVSSANGSGRCIDKISRYIAVPTSPKIEIERFAQCTRMVNDKEVIAELVSNLSEFSARAIASELEIGKNVRGLLEDATPKTLVDAASRAAAKRTGRANKEAEYDCVRQIKRMWRAIAGPRGNCISYPGPYGDCYDLVCELNQQLGVDKFLPIEPLTDSD